MKRLNDNKNQFAVIGLGRFGSSVAKTLFDKGKEVLVIDNKEENVRKAEEYSTNAAVADVTDESVLKSLGVENFDVVIVAMSSNLAASIMCVLTCKELGVKRVIAKARSSVHKAALEKVGADEVVIPEMEMGEKMAIRLANPFLHDVLAITDKHSIIEMDLPDRWSGKTLVELDLRRKFNVNVIAVERDKELLVGVSPNEALKSGDALFIIGKKETLDLLQNQYD